MQQNYNKKRKLNKLRASLLLLMMVCFAGVVMAQEGGNIVWMREGRTNLVSGTPISFYDSHGPAEPSTPYDDESGMKVNYWDKWYTAPEQYTHTFIAPNAAPYVKVTFNKYTAYDWSDNGNYQAVPPVAPYNCQSIGQWSLRLNDDWLYVYEGTAVDETKLIGAYTGNSRQEFTIIAQGAMTFRFVSNDLFREEGWGATVQAVASMTPQPPYMRRSICNNSIELESTTLGATIYYSTDGNDPDPDDILSENHIYDGTPIDWGTGDLKVSAISRLNNVSSAVSRETFTDTDRIPSINTDAYKPDLKRPEGTNKVKITCPSTPGGLNETFVVYYTDGITATGEPSMSNYSMKLIFVNANIDLEDEGEKVHNVHRSRTYEFECTNPNAVFRAKIYGFTCQNLQSPVAGPLTFGNILVDDPEITFATTNLTQGTGTATITCAFTGATIYYTTDGSEPDLEHVGGTNPTQQYTGTFSVTAGTTVKAKAAVSQTGFNPSNTVSDLFVPTNGNNEPQNGVYGDVVLLDDTEPHEWSYYSDGDQPVHRLNPADVKITYYGYGNNTMTTTDITPEPEPTAFNGNVASTAVAVGPGNANKGNQFVYLKTLENAAEDGTGNYPYTMIPNPFSKRPTSQDNGGQSVTPETRDVYISWSRSNNNCTGEVEYRYTDVNGSTQTDVSSINGTGNTTITVQKNSNVRFRLRRTSNGGSVSFTARYDNASGQQFANGTANSNTWQEIGTYSIPASASTTINFGIYRGFYAWRVKRLSNGLTIQSKDGSTTYGVGGIIPAEAEIEFVTANAKDNEVDFEALWAQACVSTSNDASNLYSRYSYERNFVVGATPSPLGVPVTYSRYNPDGTGNGTSTLNAGFTCQADTKFEYINVSNSPTVTAANHDLVFGRGISGTVGNLQGINETIGSTDNPSGLNYMIRLESGTFSQFAFVRKGTNTTVYGRVQVRSILGCDYDRAQGANGNNNLTICPTNNNNSSMFFTQLVNFYSESNKDQKVFDCVIKSGKFQEAFWAANIDNNPNGNQTSDNAFNYRHSIYCGANFSGDNNDHYPGIRYVTVEGGEMGNINGGRGTGAPGNNSNPNATTNQTDASVVSFKLRIKHNPIIHGCVFGGAANTSAWGSKSIIVTGGEIQSWIAGGANGTNFTSGDSRTRGTANIYVGGKALVGGPNVKMKNGTAGGQIFGAGRGNALQAASMDNSNVVVADNAQVENVYGGGFHGYITNTSKVYILGGIVSGNVYGGAYENAGTYNNNNYNNPIPTSNVYVQDGIIEGSVYGGSNSNGTVANSHINMSGGTTTNVFGGGLGASTVIGQNTSVTIDGGTINNNVYGGGQLGSVTSNTAINISGGTMKNVFGAGLGTKYTGTAWPPTTANANIGGSTSVSISGGTVNESVYGGGENGSVAFATGGATSDNTSTVNVSGGQVKGDVFGGGREGTTQGRTIVNISGGDLENNVFGGAYGVSKRVYVAGTHTVNLMGNNAGGYPYIKGCVYGGSRLANDGNDLDITDGSFSSSNETALSSVINISGGRVKEHVYAAGFYGNCFGSCYINIGSLAVQNGPFNTDDKAFQTSNIYIQGTVWAGGDWGTFAGNFGAPTITGNTNIYVDGEGYDTESKVYTDENYMGIGSSILGCGTSCYAGKADRHLVMRNYGEMKTDGGTLVNPVTGTTRELYSSQLFTKVFFDDSHITLKGQGKMDDLNVTEKYGLYGLIDERDNKIGGAYVLNGSTLVLNAPASQLNSYNSATCTNTLVAEPQCTTMERDVLYANIPYIQGEGGTLNPNPNYNANLDNKVRVNNGSYIEVKYDKTTGTGQNAITETLYGPVDGYTHMMTSAKTDEATCAYARPKNAVSSPVANAYDNPSDGGFLSYDDYYNKYKADGTLVEAGGQYELVYENHAPTSKNDNEYFRVWRYGGGTHYVEGVINVNQVGEVGASGTPEYRTVDLTVQLPAWRAANAYYRFDRTGDAGSYYTMIDYGTDVITYNAACYGTTPGTNNWMYFGTDAQVIGTGSANCPEISMLGQNPDQNFGLIIMPGTAMESDDEDESNYIICSTSDSYIAENMRYNCSDYMKMPTVTFRLTYKNNINSNTTWDPVTIPLMQCVPGTNGEVEYELVYITITVSTETVIESTFNTQLYATMKGEGTSNRQRLQGSIVLPTFETDVFPAEARFYVESAKFTQGVALMESSTGSGYYNLENPTGTVQYKAHTNDMDVNSFGLTVVAVPTPDIMDDWRQVQPEFDCGPLNNGQTATWNYQTVPQGHQYGEGYLGYAGGRNGLSIGFNLYYSDIPKVAKETLMGTLEIGIMFTHYAETGTGADNIGHFKVIVQVYRRGEGANFYVDGIYGNDDTQVDRGLFPNYAAKSVEFVLSRLGYKPGDNIFIVNTVNINKPLKWDGSKKQDNVNIWRYPGNHPLKSFEVNGTSTIIPIENNALNNAFTGVLFNVNKKLTVTSIKVDGMYDIAKTYTTVPRPLIFPATPNPSDEGSIIFDGQAQAPLFVVNDEGELHLRSVTKLLYNYNGNAGTGEGATFGGAVWVKNGGLLTMNETADITGNINANGGGVYMDGGMVASGYAYVFNNFKAPASAKAAQEQSNVWLTKGYTEDPYKVVQIGLVDDEAYNELLTSSTANAKIGIDKEYSNDANKMDDYLPVVYTAPSTINYLEAPYNANRANAGEGIIVHDRAKYKLEKYTPNNYLYWLSTWVTFQDHEPDNRLVDGVPEGTWDGIGNIHTPQQLAWFISLVNGENNATANTFANTTINITDDISMDGHVWVPIGTPSHPFMGTFEGNGHVITDMYGSLIQTNMGMFGYTEGATIQDAVVSTNFTGTNDNLGTVVGTMNGGTLSNVEGAGSILNKFTEGNMGGLVGNNVGGTIHSAFAVADMKGGSSMGGLVGKNTGNLYNAYSNVDFSKIEGQSGSMTVAGLVYDNTGKVQNCYVIEGTHTNGTFYPFAATSNGNIDYCYAAKPAEGATVTYVGNGTQPTTHGTYDVVKDRKAIGYMYDDNKTEKVGTGTNNYVKSAIAYNGGKISTWPGLLSTLNQWVVANPEGIDPKPTTWFRSTSSYKDGETVKAYINGDLPVLGFPKDNSLATEDGKFLYYGAYNLNPQEGETFNNGLDSLFKTFSDKDASMFLYGNATGVTKSNGDNMLFINEDAVLTQALAEGENEMAEITATVGVTFDNSCKTAVSHLNNTLEYDWHFMSSALQDAPINATFGAPTGFMNQVNITGMDVNSYFPNGLPMTAGNTTGVQWDFYTYLEQDYHWINLKRSDHYYQDSGESLSYTNETSFVPGKGYMMAISQDSYMNSTGVLNNDEVPIAITSKEPEELEYNLGWNLVGNPYHAYLDLVALFGDADNSNANAAYVYDADLGIYTPFVDDASENPSIIERYLHQHQAFFVHSKAETATLTFKPEMATATIAQGYSAPYYRGEGRINYPLVNLFASSENGGRDLAVIEFNRPELGGATKVNGLRNAKFQVAASLEGQRYGLVFTPEGTEKVPVHFTTEENGTFTLTWETMHGDFTSLLLVDNMTGTITDMLRADHYTFDATTEDYASRFYITYTVTGVDEYNEGDGSFAFFDGSEWVVNGKGQLDIVDVTGRVLFSKRLANEHNRVSLNGVANGVYLMRVSDGNNTMVQKIVVK